MKEKINWVQLENPFSVIYRAGTRLGYGAQARMEYSNINAKVVAVSDEKYKIVISEPVRTRNAGDILTVNKTSVFIPKEKRDYTDDYVDAYWQK